jgi:hypothetical protein
LNPVDKVCLRAPTGWPRVRAPPVTTLSTQNRCHRGSCHRGRWPRTRAVETVDVAGLPVRVKVSPGRVKAEHDEAARVARLRQVPLHEVMSRAEGEARRRAATDPDGPLDSGPTPA